MFLVLRGTTFIWSLSIDCLTLLVWNLDFGLSFKQQAVKIVGYLLFLWSPQQRKIVSSGRRLLLVATVMRSKILTCQPQTVSLIAPFWLDDVRSNTVGFWFSSRASSGPFGWIFDWKVREESWIFWPLCCEVWKQSDAILREKIAPALERFQNKVSTLVSLL